MRTSRALCAAAVIGLLTLPAFAQTETYEEAFTGGASSPAQGTAWATFRAALGSGYDSVTMSGSLDMTGVTCTDPAVVDQIAAALTGGGTVSLACDGNNWQVGGCGGGPELTIATGGICFCDNPTYTVRPQIGNSNWGGINGATCGAPTQTMKVEFAVAGGGGAGAPGSSPLTLAILAGLIMLAGLGFVTRS